VLMKQGTFLEFGYLFSFLSCCCFRSSKKQQILGVYIISFADWPLHLHILKYQGRGSASLARNLDFSYLLSCIAVLSRFHEFFSPLSFFLSAKRLDRTAARKMGAKSQPERWGRNHNNTQLHVKREDTEGGFAAALVRKSNTIHVLL